MSVAIVHVPSDTSMLREIELLSNAVEHISSPTSSLILKLLALDRVLYYVLKNGQAPVHHKWNNSKHSRVRQLIGNVKHWLMPNESNNMDAISSMRYLHYTIPRFIKLIRLIPRHKITVPVSKALLDLLHLVREVNTQLNPKHKFQNDIPNNEQVPRSTFQKTQSIHTPQRIAPFNNSRQFAPSVTKKRKKEHRERRSPVQEHHSLNRERRSPVQEHHSPNRERRSPSAVHCAVHRHRSSPLINGWENEDVLSRGYDLIQYHLAMYMDNPTNNGIRIVTSEDALFGLNSRSLVVSLLDKGSIGRKYILGGVSANKLKLNTAYEGEFDEEIIRLFCVCMMMIHPTDEFLIRGTDTIFINRQHHGISTANIEYWTQNDVQDRTILIPVNFGGGHWVLVYINPGLQQLYVMDPLDYKYPREPVQLINLTKQWYSAICQAKGLPLPNWNTWNTRCPLGISKQPDGYSCGAYVCIYIYELLVNRRFAPNTCWQSVDVTKIRLWIAACLDYAANVMNSSNRWRNNPVWDKNNSVLTFILQY
jgi:hypothetical protein